MKAPVLKTGKGIMLFKSSNLFSPANLRACSSNQLPDLYESHMTKTEEKLISEIKKKLDNIITEQRFLSFVQLNKAKEEYERAKKTHAAWALLKEPRRARKK